MRGSPDNSVQNSLKYKSHSRNNLKQNYSSIKDMPAAGLASNQIINSNEKQLLESMSKAHMRRNSLQRSGSNSTVNTYHQLQNQQSSKKENRQYTIKISKPNHLISDTNPITGEANNLKTNQSSTKLDNNDPIRHKFEIQTPQRPDQLPSLHSYFQTTNVDTQSNRNAHFNKFDSNLQQFRREAEVLKKQNHDLSEASFKDQLSQVKLIQQMFSELKNV